MTTPAVPPPREQPPSDAPMEGLANAMRWTPSEHPAPPGLGWVVAGLIVAAFVVGWLLPVYLPWSWVRL